MESIEETKVKEQKITNHDPNENEMVEFYEYSKNNKGDVIFVKTKEKRWHFEHLLYEFMEYRPV